ncbi:MAG: tRNA-dihydrouridine synthase [Faecalibacterium prausnitzii]
MEGPTDRIWRQAHARARSAPLLCPHLPCPRTGCLSKRRWQSFDSAANPGAPVIPALLAKDGALPPGRSASCGRWATPEVNLNFGCPSGTVTAKGKGADAR